MVELASADGGKADQPLSKVLAQLERDARDFETADLEAALGRVVPTSWPLGVRELDRDGMLTGGRLAEVVASLLG